MHCAMCILLLETEYKHIIQTTLLKTPNKFGKNCPFSDFVDILHDLNEELKHVSRVPDVILSYTMYH